MRTVAVLGIVMAILGIAAPAAFGQQGPVGDYVGYSGPAGSVTEAPLSSSVPCCRNRGELFVEFLYLRPSHDRVPVAVPINGAIVPPEGAAPIQAGDMGQVDIGYHPAFRLGGTWTLSECSQLEGSYTRFEGTDHLSTETNPPLVLRSMLSHPGTFAAPTDFLSAVADYDVQFQFADADYRRIWWSCDRFAISYLVGARYAHMTQQLNATLSNSTTSETVDTHLTFDGGGLRLGLEAERYAPCSGLMIYGSSAATFLGGVSRGDFVQRNSTSGTDPLVVAGWSEDRIVPILEIEAGIGWTSPSGCFRVKAGYQVTSWFNIPTTDNFIQAVHQNRSSDLNETMTFDGLNLRTEILF